MNLYLDKIKTENNPFIITNEAGYFIADSLRRQCIKLYDAYLINGECIRIRMAALALPAWGKKTRITDCISILNQKLMAHVFGDATAIEYLIELANKVVHLNTDKRQHYIINSYMQFMKNPIETSLLEMLSEIREKYNSLSDDDGPYHTESFPWDYCVPENILLGKLPFKQPENIFSSPEAEDIFVALAQL